MPLCDFEKVFGVSDMNKFVFVSLFLMMACASQQQVGQNVVVNNGDLAKAIEKLSDKVVQPSTASTANPAPTQLNPSVSVNPLTSASPIAGPSVLASGTVSTATGFAIFETGIPEPSSTVSYSEEDIATAKEAWKKRYISARTNPAEVLKMYFDALLLAASNKSLCKELLKVTALYLKSDSDTELDSRIAAFDNGRQLRSLYRGTKKKDGFQIPDFINRTLNVYKSAKVNSVTRLVESSLDDATVSQKDSVGNLDFTLVSVADEFVARPFTVKLMKDGTFWRTYWISGYYIVGEQLANSFSSGVF